MKRGKVFSILFLGISFLCVGGLFAQGESDGAKKGSSSSVSQDLLGKYDPPITISAGAWYFDNVKYFKGENAENNVWIREYKDVLGINLKYNWISTTPPQYDDKVNVIIASGDLPDVMPVNMNQLARLAKSNLIRTDIKELLDKYGSPMLKQIYTMDGPEALASATFDGKLMALLRTDAALDMASLMWLRKDWLDKLGLSAPTTYADLVKVIDAFTTKDPNGTGAKNYVGLALSKDIFLTGLASIEGFANIFHAYPRMWVPKNGKLVFGSYQPEMRQALLELQKLYKAGKMDPEFAVQDVPKTSEASIAGRNGVEFGMMWNPFWPLQACRDNDPKADWQAYPLPSVDGKPAKPGISTPVRAYYVISKKAKNPEAIIKMLNVQVERFFGGRKGDYEKYMDTTINGERVEPHIYPVVLAWTTNKNLEVYRSVKEAIKKGDTSSLNTEQLTAYNDNLEFKNGNNKKWGAARIFGDEGSFRVIDYYQKNKVSFVNQFYGADTPTMMKKQASLDKMEIEMIATIIMGAPIENFDKFVESARKLGGDDIEKEVNEWYASVKK